jgi:hypothetical protein
MTIVGVGCGLGISYQTLRNVYIRYRHFEVVVYVGVYVNMVSFSKPESFIVYMFLFARILPCIKKYPFKTTVTKKLILAFWDECHVVNGSLESIL